MLRLSPATSNGSHLDTSEHHCTMSGVWSHDERTALMVLFEEYPALTTAQRGDIFGRIFDADLRSARRRYAPQALADQVSR